jgi:hypothetical protein
MGQYSKIVKRRIPGNWSAAGTITVASLSTNLTGTNNDLTFTSKAAGAGHATGNSTTIAYVVAGASTPLTVDVTDTDIVVNVATNGGSAATSTAAQVKAAIEADTDAAALVTVANKTGNDGTGVVTALAETPLAGGADYVIGTSR